MVTNTAQQAFAPQKVTHEMFHTFLHDLVKTMHDLGFAEEVLRLPSATSRFPGNVIRCNGTPAELDGCYKLMIGDLPNRIFIEQQNVNGETKIALRAKSASWINFPAIDRTQGGNHTEYVAWADRGTVLPLLGKYLGERMDPTLKVALHDAIAAAPTLAPA